MIFLEGQLSFKYLKHMYSSFSPSTKLFKLFPLRRINLPLEGFDRKKTTTQKNPKKQQNKTTTKKQQQKKKKQKKKQKNNNNKSQMLSSVSKTGKQSVKRILSS